MTIIASLLGFIGGVLALLGGYIAKQISKIVSSVDALNIKIAIVIEKIQGHEKRIVNIEKKLGRK